MLQGIGSVLVTLAGLVTAAFKFGGKSSRMRARVTRDIELLNKLSAEAASREVLAGHIDDTVKRFVAMERQNDVRRTDWTGIATVIALAVIGTPIAVYLLKNDVSIYVAIAGWAAVIFCALFVVVGLAVSIRAKPEAPPTDN
jgi:Flp pilus assembly protein TadB